MTHSPTAAAEHRPAPSAADDRQRCETALPHVSRTFALCIRFLPDELEYSVLIAYLLCRIADTIEDSVELGTADQRRLLGEFRTALDAGAAGDVPALRSAFATATSHDERLAADTDVVLREFRRLPRDHQDAVRPWVQEMCDGMAEFAGLQAGAELRVLPDMAALERYCYYVAGTVGHLLTALFRLRMTPDAARDRRLESLATNFGLGLQLTNIVKDVSADRKRGVSFVPDELCARVGIDAARLTDPAHRDAARAVMAELAGVARRHLDDAIEYCTTLPAAEYGIRRFCLVSVYLAAQTLALVPRDARLLEADHTVKITRADVRRTVLITSAIAPFDPLVRRYYRALLGE